MADETRVTLESTDTLTIATVDLGHKMAEVVITEEPYVRETTNQAHYPDPAYDIDGAHAEIDVKATITAATALPSTKSIVALAFAKTSGIRFSGQVMITSSNVTLNPDKSGELSFKAKTVDQDYTFDKGA